MGKAKTKTVDSRKPKHSNDSSRPSKTPVGKGGKEHRDASTVSTQAQLQGCATQAQTLTVSVVVCRSAGSTCTRLVLSETKRAKSYTRSHRYCCFGHRRIDVFAAYAVLSSRLDTCLAVSSSCGSTPACICAGVSIQGFTKQSDPARQTMVWKYSCCWAKAAGSVQGGDEHQGQHQLKGFKHGSFKSQALVIISVMNWQLSWSDCCVPGG